MFYKAFATLGACITEIGDAVKTPDREPRLDLSQGNDAVTLRCGMNLALWGVILIAGITILFRSVTNADANPASQQFCRALLALYPVANLLLVAGLAVCLRLPVGQNQRALLIAAIGMLGLSVGSIVYFLLWFWTPLGLPFHIALISIPDLLLPLGCICAALFLKELAIDARHAKLVSIASSTVILAVIAFGAFAANFIAGLTNYQSIPLASAITLMALLGYLVSFARLCAKWIDTLAETQTYAERPV